MLSLFPEVMFLAPFAATLFRIALTIILWKLAAQHAKPGSLALRVLALFEVVAGLLVLGGAYTQAAALLAVLLLGASLLFRPLRVLPGSTLALSVLIALSLVVTGPGPLGFDLPL